MDVPVVITGPASQTKLLGSEYGIFLSQELNILTYVHRAFICWKGGSVQPVDLGLG